jgi:hypothetical protein
MKKPYVLRGARALSAGLASGCPGLPDLQRILGLLIFQSISLSMRSQAS